MTVTTPRRIFCPRCEAPVTGDFKFCPACAFRLQAAPGAEVDLPGRPPRWAHLLVAVGGLVLVAGLLVAGLHLFSEDRTSQPADSERAPVHGVFRVRDHLLDLMVYLEQGGIAMYWRDEDRGEDLPVYVSAMKFMPFEVTRGMYADYLEACRDHPEAIPGLLRDLWRPEPGLRAYAEVYVDRWWELVERQLNATSPGPSGAVERPADLHAPLPERYALLVMTPPSWCYLGNYGDILWRIPEGTENLPVTEVSWYDAVAFAEWASSELGEALRLPMAVEWIRAGHGNRVDYLYPWGVEPLRYACNNLNFYAEADAARLLDVDYRYSDAEGASVEGLWGMSGNAREWALNQWAELQHSAGGNAAKDYYVFAYYPERDAQLEAAPTLGGSFRQGIGDCTVTWSSLEPRDKRSRWDDVGFRLMMHTLPR